MKTVTGTKVVIGIGGNFNRVRLEEASIIIRDDRSELVHKVSYEGLRLTSFGTLVRDQDRITESKYSVNVNTGKANFLRSKQHSATDRDKNLEGCVFQNYDQFDEFLREYEK